MLDPDRWDSRIEFGIHFCKGRRQRGQWVFKGASNTRELNQILKDEYMIRRRKRDVLKDLPAKSQVVVPLRLKNMKDYREAENNFLSWLGKKNKVKALRAAKAEAVTRLGYLKRHAANLKLEQAKTWIADALENGTDKIVVFAQQKHIVADLHKTFPNSVVLNGDTPARKKQLAIDQFQKNKSTNLFIGSEAALTGINLTAADTVVFCELFWTPADHDQAISRIDRIGQKRPTTAYFLIALDTIEEDIARITQTKQGTIEAVLDGGKQSDGLYIFDELLRQVERRRNGK